MKNEGNIAFNYFTLAMVYVGWLLSFPIHFVLNLPFDAFSITGLLLSIPSLVFFTMARIKLGNAFQASAEANKLVTTGIYRVIRHPVYFFGTWYFLGLILFLHLFFLLVIWVGIIVIQIIRIKKEEKVLLEKFGDEYINYKKKTWF